MKVICLWRNLGDTILSLDDHLLKEHWETSAVYISNEAEYRGLSVNERHKFLIQYGLPWYISFYLAWREVKDREWLIHCRYEDMVQDKVAFFSRIFSALGQECDNARLQRILDARHDHSRFNVGIVGRSVQGLSENNKLLLERLLIDHPHDLSDLLNELPWRLGVRRHGTAVRRAADFEGLTSP